MAWMADQDLLDPLAQVDLTEDQAEMEAQDGMVTLVPLDSPAYPEGLVLLDFVVQMDLLDAQV